MDQSASYSKWVFFPGNIKRFHSEHRINVSLQDPTMKTEMAKYISLRRWLENSVQLFFSKQEKTVLTVYPH